MVCLLQCLLCLIACLLTGLFLMNLLWGNIGFYKMTMASSRCLCFLETLIGVTVWTMQFIHHVYPSKVLEMCPRYSSDPAILSDRALHICRFCIRVSVSEAQSGCTLVFSRRKITTPNILFWNPGRQSPPFLKVNLFNAHFKINKGITDKLYHRLRATYIDWHIVDI